MSSAVPDNDVFRAFLRRTWREDIAPSLRDHRAAQRRKVARATGKAAAATGLLLDTVFGLKGKPFARFMTVVGSNLGAILPDVWDWQWLRESASSAEREVVDRHVSRRARALPEADALALFGLPPTATRADLKVAWREAAQRWHPDKAADAAARNEHHLRFLAYQAAYERLCAAYDAGRLPQ